MAKWIEFAHIATSAAYRNGLVSILEAGVGLVTAESLPATAELTVVSQFAFTEPDVGIREKYVIAVIDPNGNYLAEASGEVESSRPPDADLEFPYTWTVIQRFFLQFQEFGYYTIKIILGETVDKTLKFHVKRIESGS